MDKEAIVKGVDLPLGKLVPLHKRNVRKSSFRKLLSSIQAVGLIEPLLVYPEGDTYIILDGYLRYRACQELALAQLPCIVVPTKEAYTPNRMVNHLSPVQENRMLVQSLGTLEEETIAGALGLASIRHRITGNLLKRLHPEVVRTFDKKCIPLSRSAQDLTFVKPEYQLVVLEEMEKAQDFSPGFARTVIIRAPEEMRNGDGRTKTPWSSGEKEKEALTQKLEDAEKRHEFFTGLYRQYVADLLKLCIYVRRLVTNPKLGDYLKTEHPDLLGRFQEILSEADGKDAT